MSTFVDGVGASENIDTTGERIIIAGMDISSLPVDGVANWEHKNDSPDQVVGKVLKAKKIFSEKDCDDERQAYFWQKTQVPYVYVLIELFDDYKESAKEVAGMFRYDTDKKGKNEKSVMNFSIEGAKIEKQGMDIVRSIARKVTITCLPANKAAVAEMVSAPTKKPKDDLDSIFKTEPSVEIELFQPQENSHIVELFKKESPMKKDETNLAMASSKVMNMKKSSTADRRGHVLTETKSGKEVFSHGKVGEYEGFSSQDHKDAMNAHHMAAKDAKDPKLGRHHFDKARLHMQAAGSAEKHENRAANTSTAMKRPIIKAETAGSMNVAPSQLTGNAALTKESLDKKLKKADEKGVHQSWDKKSLSLGGASPAGTRARMAHKLKEQGKDNTNMMSGAKESHKKVLNELKAMPKPNLPKSERYWLARAEQEYAQWNKKEDFRKFMKKRLPKLALGEIDAIGQALILKKSIDAENALSQITGLEKSEQNQDSVPASKKSE